ncbi:MAG: M28 family metallopeptidase [Terriglobales bacterium]
MPPSRVLHRVAFLALFLASVLLRAQSAEFKPVTREAIESRLQRYRGKNPERESTLKQMFAEVGCDGHVSEQPVKHANSPNIICALPGTGDRFIVVGAHYDYVSAGAGVVDNWSGASLLPSLYEAINIRPRQHTYIFIGFTDEEKGEVGSHFYVKQMTAEEVAKTDAMVNMDTLGLAPTEIWLSHSDKFLAEVLVYVAGQLKLPLSAVNVDQVGSSDSEQFAARNMPRITVHSLTQKTWDERILHTSKDQFSAIHLDDYYQSYDLIAAYLAVLDTATRPANTK